MICQTLARDHEAHNGGRGRVADIVNSVGEKYKIPGIAAAVVTSHGIEDLTFYGIRKYRTDNHITENDLWHLGSNTKMMTAALAAICINRGLISWETTVYEVFKSKISINPDYREVSLRALLSHRSGLPANVDYYSVSKNLPIREQRLGIVQSVLSEQPITKPGSSFLYSNIGYIIAGAMIETVCNEDWETLMCDYIFGPLDMTSAGFGGTGTINMIDQPWGHNSPMRPYKINGPEADNPPVIGPAGTVHCTLQDWSKFIIDQLRGAQGEQGLLGTEDYRYMQYPHYADNYGLGWFCVEREWANGMAFTHTGSNTLFWSLVWLVPGKDMAVLVCTNEGKFSEKAANDIVVEILKYKGLIH